MNVNQQNELQQFLKKYKIKQHDYCIAGSFCMDVFGVKEADDLDLCLRTNDRTRIMEQNDVEDIIENNELKVHAVMKSGGILRLLEHVGLTEDDVIENPRYYFMYRGHKVLRPELNYAEKLYRLTKIELARPKDFRSNKILLKYLSSVNYKNSYITWDDSLVLYPNTKIEHIKMTIMHSFLHVLFAIKPIERNWLHIKKFFWMSRHKSFSLALNETRRVLFKNSQKS